MPLSDRLVPTLSSTLGGWWSVTSATGGVVNVPGGLNVESNQRLCLYKTPTTSDAIIGWMVGRYAKTNQTDAEYVDSNSFTGFSNSTVSLGSRLAINWGSAKMVTFIRRTGRFDVVQWTGNGASSRTLTHSVGLHGLVIMKCTSAQGTPWMCNFGGTPASTTLTLNTNARATTGNTSFSSITSSRFTVNSSFNVLGNTYIALIFAGGTNNTGGSTIRTSSYTGTGTSDLVLNFSLGKPVKLMILKSHNATGNWIVMDVESDTYWTLNTTDAPKTLSTIAVTHPSGIQLKAGGVANTKSVGYRCLAFF